jgi:hypothetical protein
MNLGAIDLAGLCKDLELLGKESRLQPAASIFAKLEAEYELVCAALSIECKEEIRVGSNA